MFQSPSGTGFVQVTDNTLFGKAWELLEGYFLPNEYRSYQAQLSMLSHPKYKMYVLLDTEANIISMIAFWNFTWIIFIEHIVVISRYQHKGFASALLSFVKQYHVPIVLETNAENSCDDFYTKNGFIVNKYCYTPLKLKDKFTPPKLSLVSYPNELTQDELYRFMKEISKDEYLFI